MSAEERQHLMASLQSRFAGLAPAEQKLAAFVLENPVQVVNLSVTQLAEAVGTAEATVTRFCRSIGLKGYQELRLRLARDMARGMAETAPTSTETGIVQSGDGAASLARKLSSLSAQSIEATLQMMDLHALEEAVAAICEARRIRFYGVGESWPLCYMAQIRLLGLGLTAEANFDSHLQAISSALLGQGDVAFGISHMGATKDVAENLKTAKTNGAKTICLTVQGRSPVTSISDIRLICVTQDLTLEGWTLRTKVSQMMVLDLLITMVALHKHGQDWQERVTEAVLDKLY